MATPSSTGSIPNSQPSNSRLLGRDLGRFLLAGDLHTFRRSVAGPIFVSFFLHRSVVVMGIVPVDQDTPSRCSVSFRLHSRRCCFPAASSPATDCCCVGHILVWWRKNWKRETGEEGADGSRWKKWKRSVVARRFLDTLTTRRCGGRCALSTTPSSFWPRRRGVLQRLAHTGQPK